MNTEIDLQLLYRRRRTLDELRRCVDAASNALGPALQLVRPIGKDHISLHSACSGVQRQLGEIQKNLLSAATECKKALPAISNLAPDLYALDATMRKQELQLCSWLQSQIIRPKKAWATGDMGDLETPFWIIFELSSSIDPEFSAIWYPLVFRIRFPCLKVVRFLGEVRIDRIQSPLFQFGRWSRTANAFEPPDTKLESEVLYECCCQTPEIAYVAGAIVNCTFRVEGGNSWTFNLEYTGQPHS